MTPPIPAGTGLASLDDVLGGLRLGDNVVWQVDDMKDYEHYVTPFVRRAAAEGRKVVYMRFATHEPLLTAGPDITVHHLDARVGFESFTTEVYDIITREGRNTYYVFDCLSFLLSAWATDLMIGNFFVITCPYLFELDTIAYFSILRHSHSFKTVARIRETTQLLLEVYCTEGDYYVHPLKVWNRYSPTMFLPHHEENGTFAPIITSVDATRLFSDISRREAKSARRHLDHWDRLFMKAEDLSRATGCDEEKSAMIDELCRVMIGREQRIVGLVKKSFTLEDLLAIKSRLIGTGFIGGKAVGMLLARKILEDDRSLAWRDILEQHDSFFIGSDIFYTYLVQNGLWKLRMEQRTKEGYFDAALPLREKMLKGIFPDEIREQFQQLIEYFGQSPIIIRSSSLLEDNFGNAFAGKYESFFSVNQGPPERRFNDFVECVRKVFASTMNEDALAYRLQRGLDQKDEQMALLVQRVSGSHRHHHFFPDMAGVGVSHNTFLWREGMNQDAGMLRLVLGLGTRAVNRVENDYPRIVALDNPLFRPHSGIDEIRKFSQREMDVLDTEQNTLRSVPLSRELSQNPTMPLDLLALRDYETMERMRDRGGRFTESWIVTFDELLSQTPFPAYMQGLLKTLEGAYDYPVETEFTVNFTEGRAFRINLLQCRPVQPKGTMKHVVVPADLPPERILFQTQGHFMGGSLARRIDRIIYIDPPRYTALSLSQKYDVARLVGKFNRLIKNREETPTMLLGPGRWGTSTPSLGVPVTFSEINNITVMGEMAFHDGNLMPELSFGTHFFQDLVETDIFYLALFPEPGETVLNDELLESFHDSAQELLLESFRYRGVVRVHDTAGTKLTLMADMGTQRLVCFIDRGEN